MRNRVPFSALTFISLALLLSAGGLAAYHWRQYTHLREIFPAGQVMAGTPVGGLDREEASRRLEELYSQPVELHYEEAHFHLAPEEVGFKLDLEGMLAAAGNSRKPFRRGYWDYLWGQKPSPEGVPLKASYSQQQLRDYLEDVSARYDRSPLPPTPVLGTVDFQPGQPGRRLDADRAVALIDTALHSLTNRQVKLPVEQIEPPPPELQVLEALLKQTLELYGFSGLAGIYLADLQEEREIHFAWQNGQDLPVDPDVAFSASSIIKIPIMVSAFQRMGGEADAETERLLRAMIEESGNESADWLMQRVIDQERGPLLVTEDMQALGLENTFLAGYFTLGSPLLALYDTPGNLRIDVNTDPDIYSQTSPSDIGRLLEGIYRCAQVGQGDLFATYPETITPAECQAMVTHLENNRLPWLLTEGLPEGTKIAHKHGWGPPGRLNMIADAGIIYSPGGDYVLVVFLYHREEMVWEPATLLVAGLSRAAYNFFNLP